jgi:hypothetical protein
MAELPKDDIPLVCSAFVVREVGMGKAAEVNRLF